MTAAAPLALALTASADRVAAGDTLEYVLRFGNRGTVAQLMTTLTLTLPAGTSVLDADGATLVDGTATWMFGTMEVGQAGERRVRVRVDDLGAADPLVRLGRAQMTSGTVEARAAVVTEVEAAAPLALAMVATPDPVAPGGLITYQLTVTNRRTVAAAGMEVRMPVPEYLNGSFGCRSASDGGMLPSGCAAGRDIVWTLGTLAVGASRTVQFVGQAASAASLPDGTLIPATSRVRDAATDAARAGVIIAVKRT